MHEVRRAAAVSDRVDRDDATHALIVGSGGDRNASAERPADERDRVRVDLGNRLEEADARTHVLALLLRDEPAACALAPPEPAVVEREAHIAVRDERTCETRRMDDLQALVARARDHGRPTLSRLEAGRQVQLAVEPQAVAEERDGPALHA